VLLTLNHLLSTLVWLMCDKKLDRNDLSFSVLPACESKPPKRLLPWAFPVKISVSNWRVNRIGEVAALATF